MSKSLSSRKASSRKESSKKASSSKSSSSKSSSRKSSSRKSLSKNMFVSASKMDYESYKNKRSMNACFISIIIHILILYYIINLEDISCNCITDWRHNYIKYITIFMIIMNILYLFSVRLTNNNLLESIFLVLSLVNMYALYTYVGDLNDTKCSCAVDKQKTLNTFLYYYRYIFIIMFVLFIIGVILLLFSLRTLSS